MINNTLSSVSENYRDIVKQQFNKFVDTTQANIADYIRANSETESDKLKIPDAWKDKIKDKLNEFVDKN